MSNINYPKIVHITYSLNMGGLENVILNLTRGMDHKHFAQNICVLSDELSLKPQFDAMDIPVFSIPKKNAIDVSLIFKLKNFFIQQKFDLIHTHNPMALLYGGSAALLSKKKIIHTEHSNLMQHKKLMMLAESFLFKKINRLVADTDEVKQNIHDVQNISLDKIDVIFNGVDVQKFYKGEDKKGFKENLGIHASQFLIGTVARLTPIKDQKTLITAIQILKQKDIPVKLVIVGDGELRQELEDFAKQCDVKDCVIFLGERNDTANILRALDVFVLCSLYEGMSVSLLEAMSSSLPCIVTDVGGNPELISDNINGFVVPPKNPETISIGIEKLILQPDLGGQMGCENQKILENKYSLKIMAQAYEKIYDEVLK